MYIDKELRKLLFDGPIPYGGGSFANIFGGCYISPNKSKNGKETIKRKHSKKERKENEKRDNRNK